MERIIDYLAEEEAQEKARNERRARINKLLKNLTTVQPQPVSLDFLGD